MVKINPMIEDEFQRRTHVEAEVLEVAFMYHGLAEDPEVKEANKSFTSALDAIRKDD